VVTRRFASRGEGGQLRASAGLYYLSRTSPACKRPVWGAVESFCSCRLDELQGLARYYSIELSWGIIRPPVMHVADCWGSNWVPKSCKSRIYELIEEVMEAIGKHIVIRIRALNLAGRGTGQGWGYLSEFIIYCGTRSHSQTPRYAPFAKTQYAKPLEKSLSAIFPVFNGSCSSRDRLPFWTTLNHP
jgi:hypothetical protein